MSTTDLRVLAESAHFLLSHAAESVYVVDKRDGSTRVAGQHVGAPGVGLITADEQWFCSGGEGVQCLSQAGVMLSFFRGRTSADSAAQSAVWFVHDLSESAPGQLRVVFDHHEHGIWLIDLAAARRWREEPR
ncbi:MAG: hypothetical protein ACJ8G1_08080 [Vitreoscilla sp.]